MTPETRCPGKMRLNGTKVGMCHTCARHTYQTCATEPPAARMAGVWECDDWMPNQAPHKLAPTITLEEK